MGGEDFSEYSLPDHSIPAVNFHFGAVDPAKIAEFKKAGKELPTLHSSKFAPVPGADYSNRDDRNDCGGAGSHEEVGQARFLERRILREKPVRQICEIPRLRFASLGMTSPNKRCHFTLMCFRR